MLPEDLVRYGTGDFLDLDPALGADHDQRRAGDGLGGDRQVDLLVYVQGLLDEQATSVSERVENLLGLCPGLLGRGGELDQALFPTSALKNLSLNRARQPNLLHRAFDLGHPAYQPPLRNSNAGFLEELF